MRSEELFKEEHTRLDVLMNPEEARKLKGYHHHGVYVLFAKGEVQYVGQSGDLRHRLKSHINGQSQETKEIHQDIDMIGIKFPPVSETLMILHYNPPCNKSVERGKLEINFESEFRRKCKGKNNRGGDCRKLALENGYCRAHGGVGLNYQQKALMETEKILADKAQFELRLGEIS